MHILAKDKDKGIIEIKEKSKLKQLLCKHNYIVGENCSAKGLTIISGYDMLEVCSECGKIKRREFYPF